jgi:hypothetical protein
LNGHFAAFLIGNKLDSAHGFIFLQMLASAHPVPPQPLPPAFANIAEKDAVDLRKYATPVGDQGQTGRCSAFAWTHAAEMSRNILSEESPRLSPNFTMLEFQRMQGDARDYEYAYEGGDGTVNGPDPGQVLVQYGTCRQELWPDDRPRPLTREEQLEADAQRYRLEAVPLPIAMDDVKKVLSAGCPVHVSMNTGSAFSDVGRDGRFDAAEAPSGRHGRHAMLIVGYVGNFFTLKIRSLSPYCSRSRVNDPGRGPGPNPRDVRGTRASGLNRRPGHRDRGATYGYPTPLATRPR